MKETTGAHHGLIPVALTLDGLDQPGVSQFLAERFDVAVDAAKGARFEGFSQSRNRFLAGHPNPGVFGTKRQEKEFSGV